MIPWDGCKAKQIASVRLELTPEQAETVERALDLYSRILMGQVGEVGNLAREGYVSVRVPDGHERRVPTADEIDGIDAALSGIRSVIGDWIGIGHRHVHVSGKRAYEIQKALARTLAVRRNPAPEFVSTAYDGLLVRYTQDPPPVAEVVPSSAAPRAA